MAAGIMARHGWQPQAFHLRFFEREADEAAGMFGHVIDRFRIADLGWYYEVALVLAVFVIDQNDHAASFGFGDDFFNGA
jgi:hypothetical protein